MTNDLYPFQQQTVQRILALPHPIRWLEGSEMGLGKSVMALSAMRELGCGTLLIVTLGSVRKDWERYVQKWFGEQTPGLIYYGRKRKLSGPKDLSRACAYASAVQIVSYELLKEIDQAGWDGIIFDELQECVSYRSAISKLLRKLCAANPQAHVLGLSGTPLTTDPINVWNLLDILHPNFAGKPTAGGDPPWRFRRTYCEEIRNEYAYSGITHKGLRADAASQFKTLLERHMTRTIAADVAGQLPPVDIRPFIVDMNDSKSSIDCIFEKLEQMCKESTHVLVTTWNHAELERLWITYSGNGEHLHFYMTGETANRAAVIQCARDAPKSIIFATMDCISTGIDLRFVQQYLVAQPVARVHKLLQFDGRFRRLGEQINVLPTIGWLFFREGTDDDVRRKVTARLDEYMTAIRTAGTTSDLRAATAVVSSPEKLRSKLDRILTSFDDSGEEDMEDIAL